MKFRRIAPRIRIIGRDNDPRVAALWPARPPVADPPPPPDGLVNAGRLTPEAKCPQVST